MIILPAEKKINWKRPPYITLLLILVNVVIYFGYQSRDDGLLQSALEQYHQAGLFELELEQYPGFLQREIDQGRDYLPLLEEVEYATQHQEADWVASVMLLDADFRHELADVGGQIWSPETFRQWRDQREQIQMDYLDKLSFVTAALIPSDIQLVDLVTYQFLHGGLAHLIGNMIFLFLLGFTIEQALGAGRFLLTYLICGLCSGLVYCLFESESSVGLVGASGSISGLMGMYVAFYGLQKIRFFYFVGVYFDYFRAPALVILPVWLGKEIYEFYLGEASNVAYMAHAGGLAAGAAIVLLFKKSILAVREEFNQASEEEQDQSYRKEYALALNSVGQMEFAQATTRFRKLIEHYPDQLGLLEHLYHLEKLAPDSASFDEVVKRLLAAALKKNDIELVQSIYQDYHQRIGEASQLSADLYNQVLFAYLKNRQQKEAEKVFSLMRTLPLERAGLMHACHVLAENFQNSEQALKAEKYKQLLKELEQA